MSPEVITHRPYTYASDMWSLGCILYEAAVRQPAFNAKGLPQLVVKILRNAYTPIPTCFSRPFVQLVGCLLRADPEQRPSAAELLGTGFVRKHLEQMMAVVLVRQPQQQRVQGQGAGGQTLAPNEAVDPGTSRPDAESTAGAAAVVAAAPPSDVSPCPARAVEDGVSTSSSNSCQAAAAGVKSVVASRWRTPEPVLEFDMRNMAAAVKRMAKAPAAVGPSFKCPRPAGGGAKGAAAIPARVPADAAAATTVAGGVVSGQLYKGRGSRQSTRQRSPPLWQQALGYGACKGQHSSHSTAKGATAAAATGSDAVACSSLSSTHPTLRPEAEVQGKGRNSPGWGNGGEGASVKRLKGLQSQLPAPVHVSRGKVVKAWEVGAQWEQQRSKLAERRYQARCLEQRLAREQVNTADNTYLELQSISARPRTFSMFFYRILHAALSCGRCILATVHCTFTLVKIAPGPGIKSGLISRGSK